MSTPKKPAAGWPTVVVHTPRGQIRHQVHAGDALTAAAIVNSLRRKP